MLSECALTERGRSIDYYNDEAIKVDSSLGRFDTVAPFDRPFLITLSKVPITRGVDSLVLKRLDKRNVFFFSRLFGAKYQNRLSKNYEQKITPIQQFNTSVNRNKPSETFVIPAVHPGVRYKLYIKWKSQYDFDSVSFNTNASTFKQRIQRRLVFHLGIAVAAFKNVKNSYKPSTMLALYYHPRPINPNNPVRSYKGYAPQRFSIMAGLTLNSFSEERLRDDLFGNSNLLLGLAYQPFDGVRFGVGRMFFTELSDNIFRPNESSVGGTLFYSASVHISFQEMFSGLFGLIGFNSL